MPLGKPVGTADRATVGVLKGALVDVTKGTNSELSVDVGEDVGRAAAWKIIGSVHAAITYTSGGKRELLLDVQISKLISLMRFSVRPSEQVNPEKSNAQKNTTNKIHHQSI